LEAASPQVRAKKYASIAALGPVSPNRWSVTRCNWRFIAAASAAAEAAAGDSKD